MGKGAVFLDRDDTLIENVPYLGDPSLVKLMPGAMEAVQALRLAGFPLVVVSNQSGVGRGLITTEQVRSVDARMEELLGGQGIFTTYKHCYAAPGDPYDEHRKPSPLMLQEAAQTHGFELLQSYMVGNRLSDIQAGHQAGCKTILLHLRVPLDEQQEAIRLASFTAKDWPTACDWLLQSK
jgi:histidinol-phosphate phosphatase family protein